jgi:hypothetical protein
MTGGESDVLERALAVVQLIRGNGWPRWACLNDILDHFMHAYDSEEVQVLREKYPLFERDGWRCQVPGCGAYEALHLHHIVFRSHGGGDEPENLVTLCDFHHLSLHRRWISCRGNAPDRLYWELGIPPRRRAGAAGDGGAQDVAREHAGEVSREDAKKVPSVEPLRPIARIFGHSRLRDSEWWDGERIRQRVNPQTPHRQGPAEPAASRLS